MAEEIKYRSLSAFFSDGGFNIKNADPVDSRQLVADISHIYLDGNWTDVKPYPGLIVSAPSGEARIYTGRIWLEDVSEHTDWQLESSWKKIGGGAVTVATYAEAVTLATADNIGQVIYVSTKSEYDADGEGEGAAVEYDAAPYIVVGEGKLQKLAASTASGDINSEVTALQGEVGTLKTDVSDLKTKTTNLETSLGNKVDKVEGKSLVSDDEIVKLGTVEANAQVNVIETVKVDGVALEVADKAVDVILPVTGVVEGDAILSLDGKNVKSTLSFAREEVEGVDSLVVKGKDGVIGSVPVADFVADGMLESVTPVEGTNEFKFTFKKVDGSTADFNVDFSKFVDTYNADNTTLELDSSTNTFKVKDGVFEAAGEAAKVQSALEAYIGTNDAALKEVSDKATDNATAIGEINTNLDNYALKTDLDNYVTSESLGTTLGSYVTSESLGTTLADYAKTSEVDDKLKAYTNTADLTTLLDEKVDTTTLESYYNKTQVDEALAKYTTTEALNTKFGDYFTKDEVNTELAKYVLTQTFTDEQTRVNNELAKKLEASALDPYLLSATAETTYWKKEDLVAMSNTEIDSIINPTTV